MRIAHFTDVHFTAPPGRLPPGRLFSKRILGWLNVRWFGRYEDFAGVPDVLEAFLRDLDETAPDHILSTGDLTAISLPEEFEAVRAALRGLLERPDVTGIPGNHDVYVRSAVAARLYENAFGAWTRTDLSREDLPERFRELYPYPLVRRLGDSTALIALRDVRPNPLHDSSGRVGELQLEALRHALRDPGLAARRKVLAVHCGVLRRDGSPDRRFHRLRDGARLLQLAAEGGVDLVVHGHIHRRAVVPRGPRAPVPLANPGSLTAARGERAYHVYHFGPEAIRVEVRAFDAGRGRFSSRPELETSLPLAPR
ncbi:MAG: metallophosphoesterase family protein [Planctomycetota bacterium]